MHYSGSCVCCTVSNSKCAVCCSGSCVCCSVQQQVCSMLFWVACVLHSVQQQVRSMLFCIVSHSFSQHAHVYGSCLSHDVIIIIIIIITPCHASWYIGQQRSFSTPVCHWPASGWRPSCGSCSSFLLPQFFTRLFSVNQT